MRKKEVIKNPSWFKKGVSRTPWNKGKKTPQTTGEKNPTWKGDNVGYRQLHKWVRSQKPVPAYCVLCKERKKLQLSNIGGKYTRELNNWEYLCAKCHVYKDGTVNNLKNVSAARKLGPLRPRTLDPFAPLEPRVEALEKQLADLHKVINF